MKLLQYVPVVVLSLFVHGSAAGRIMPGEDFAALAEKADVVMIGHVLAVKDTSEETTLPDISPPVKVCGVETTFFADSVLKGTVANSTVVLHHYGLQAGLVNGPLLVRLPVNKDRFYLLFLKRQADGKYVPAAGQTDAAVSVRRIMEPVEGLNKVDEEDRAERKRIREQAQQVKEAPDAPLTIEFVKMVTDDGVRKRAKMRLVNRTSKAIRRYSVQAVSLREDGSIADAWTSGHQAAVGHVLVKAQGEASTSLSGHTDNYDTVRVQAVVTSVIFADGTEWEASPK